MSRKEEYRQIVSRAHAAASLAKKFNGVPQRHHFKNDADYEDALARKNEVEAKYQSAMIEAITFAKAHGDEVVAEMAAELPQA